MEQQNNFSLVDLNNLVMEVMDIHDLTPMIKKQIQNFILKYNMTPKEIARCIVWYVEVFGGTLNTVYGLGIIPNIREDAAKYFKQLELDQQKQQAEARKVVEYQDNNIIFNIKNLKHDQRKPRKQLDISQIDVEGDDQ